MKIRQLFKRKQKKEPHTLFPPNIPLFFLSFFETYSHTKILPHRRILYYPAFFIAFYCVLLIFAKEIETVATFPIILSKNQHIGGVKPPTLGGEHFFIPSQKGTHIHGVFFDNKAKTTIFYLYGNGVSLPYIDSDLQFFQNLGYNVMSFDYPGYGKSTGFPYETDVYTSTEIFYEYIKKQKQLKDQDIIIVGYSIGTAPALEIATKKDTAGIILIAPFGSRYDLANTLYGGAPQKLFFVPDSFLNKTNILGVKEPILFIHGNEDTIVPIELGKRLFRASKSHSTFIEIDNGGHNNLLDTYPKTLGLAFSTFIENNKLAEPFYFVDTNDEAFFKQISPNNGQTGGTIIEKKNFFEKSELDTIVSEQDSKTNIRFKLPLGYVNPFDLESDFSYTKFVNNTIPYNNLGYVPNDLSEITSEYIYSNKGSAFLRLEAKNALQNMARDFYNTFGTKIGIASSYRSYEYQKGIKDRGCSDALCANPGHSEHQAGLAIDVFEATSENEFLKKTDLKNYFWWMKRNAHTYGYHNTYQKGTKIDGYMKEPWHWRYVGVELATFLHQNNITLAEYYYAVKKRE